MGVAGRVFQTQGISALPPDVQSAIREKVELFDSFTEDNDPHGEHDFGAFEHEGERIFWKIGSPTSHRSGRPSLCARQKSGFPERSGQKISFQRQLLDLGVQRFHVDRGRT